MSQLPPRAPRAQLTGCLGQQRAPCPAHPLPCSSHEERFGQNLSLSTTSLMLFEMFSPQKISQSSWPFGHRACAHGPENLIRIKEKTSDLSGGAGDPHLNCEGQRPKMKPLSANRGRRRGPEAPGVRRVSALMEMTITPPAPPARKNKRAAQCHREERREGEGPGAHREGPPPPEAAAEHKPGPESPEPGEPAPNQASENTQLGVELLTARTADPGAGTAPTLPATDALQTRPRAARLPRARRSGMTP